MPVNYSDTVCVLAVDTADALNFLESHVSTGMWLLIVTDCESLPL